jgi:hypothetical protein
VISLKIIENDYFIFTFGFIKNIYLNQFLASPFLDHQPLHIIFSHKGRTYMPALILQPPFWKVKFFKKKINNFYFNTATHPNSKYTRNWQ